MNDNISFELSPLEKKILESRDRYIAACDILIEQEKLRKEQEKLDKQKLDLENKLAAAQPKTATPTPVPANSNASAWGFFGAIVTLAAVIGLGLGVYFNYPKIESWLKQNNPFSVATQISDAVVSWKDAVTQQEPTATQNIITDCMELSNTTGRSTWDTCWEYVRVENNQYVYTTKDLATAIYWNGPGDLRDTTIGQYETTLFVSEWYTWAQQRKPVLFCIENYSTANVEGTKENIEPGCYLWTRGPFMIDLASSRATAVPTVTIEKTSSSENNSGEIALHPNQTLFLTGDQFKIDENICYKNPDQLCVLLKETNISDDFDLSLLTPNKNSLEVINNSSMEEILLKNIPSFWDSVFCNNGCDYARIFKIKADGSLENFILYPNGTVQYLNNIPEVTTSLKTEPESGVASYSELRTHTTASVGTGVFTDVIYSDGMAPYTQDWLWANRMMDIQRIRKEEQPTGCDISKIYADKMWFGSGNNAGITVNGILIGQLDKRTNKHGYLFDYKIVPGDKICVTSISPDGFGIIFGNAEDMFYNYDSYCYRGNC